MQLAAYEILGDAALINRQADFYRDITADDILQTAQQIFQRGQPEHPQLFLIQKPKSMSPDRNKRPAVQPIEHIEYTLPETKSHFEGGSRFFTINGGEQEVVNSILP